MDRPDSEKKNKADVDYGPGSAEERCGLCRYFLATSPQRALGHCYEVKGPIRAQDWCELFARTGTPPTTVKE